MSKPSSDTARQLGSQSLVVLAGNVFTLVVGFPLQLLVSRTLGAEGLGIYGLVEGAVNTANGFLNFGLAQTAVRFIPAHLEKREYGLVRCLVKVAAIILLGAGGLAYLLAILALPLLRQEWPSLDNQADVVLLMGLLMPLGLLMFLAQQALRGFQEIRYLILGSSFIQLTVKAVATVIAFAAGIHLIGYILATVLANAVGLLWMAYGLFKKIGRLPVEVDDRASDPVPEWRRFATISYSQSLLGAATGQIDRFILGAFVGSGAVGVLLVLRQLQQLPQVFLQMLLMVGAPMFATAHVRGDSAEREHLYALITDWLMKTSLPLVLFLFVFGKPVLALFGPQFAEDGTVALWIFLFGQTVNLACGPLGNMAMMSGFETVMLRLSTYRTLLFVILLLVLTPTLGLLGVAIAFAMMTIFINVSTALMLRKRLAFRWWNRRFVGWLMPSAVTVAASLTVHYFDLEHSMIALAVTLIGMYAIFGAVLLAQGIHQDEKDLLRHFRDRLLGRAASA